MRHLAIAVSTLLLMTACGEADEVDQAEARQAMIKDRGLGYSDVCAAAMLDASKTEACEQDKQARQAAFRFELGDCEAGAPEALKGKLGAVNQPVTCTVRWANDLEQSKPLRSSVVLFHRIDGKLQAAMANTAK